MTIWNNNTWSNGKPNPTISAVINAPYTSSNGNLEALDLTVNSELNFNKNTLNSVVVHRDLTVKGSFNVGDKESLVMTDDDAQISGIITKNENSFTRKDVKELS